MKKGSDSWSPQQPSDCYRRLLILKIPPCGTGAGRYSDGFPETLWDQQRQGFGKLGNLVWCVTDNVDVCWRCTRVSPTSPVNMPQSSKIFWIFMNILDWHCWFTMDCGKYSSSFPTDDSIDLANLRCRLALWEDVVVTLSLVFNVI